MPVVYIIITGVRLLQGKINVARVLIIEDNTVMCDMLADGLTAERHYVDVANEGEDGLSRLLHYSYDAAIVDWELPLIPGPDLIKQYRGKGGATPILMLTGRASLNDKELGLDSGTDDYLTKPFQMRELTARVRSLLRRSPTFHAAVLQIRDIELDPLACRVSKNGYEITLAPKEYAVLEFFMKNPNQLFSVDVLIQRVWNAVDAASAEGVRASIKRLRKALGEDGESFISTLHGMGYRFDVS
jgi:DNA-binding response OmpR family regulator